MTKLACAVSLCVLLAGCATVDLYDVADVGPNLIRPVSTLSAALHLHHLDPAFAQALPMMGLAAAARAGFTGEGVPVLIIDFFGGRDTWGPEHGWAVLETLMDVAPNAQYWQLDLDRIIAEINADRREPFDPVLRALYQAMRYWNVRDQGVINMSFSYIDNGQLCSSGSRYHSSIQSALSMLVDRNVNLVASAGNNGEFVPMYPACLPQVMAIGSIYDEDVDRVAWQPNPQSGFPGCVDEPAVRGAITCFSNRGELYAVGAFVDGYEHYRGRQPFAGTSLAAPLAAGAVALLREAGLDAQQARQRLLDSATQGADGNRLFRILNASAALQGLLPLPIQATPAEP